MKTGLRAVLQPSSPLNNEGVMSMGPAADLLPSKVGAVDGDGDGAVNSLGLADCVGVDDCAPNT